jgi:hypothetical protein
VTALGRDHGVPFELPALAEQMYQRALIRCGPVAGELLAVALPEEQAGPGCVPARPDTGQPAPARRVRQDHHATTVARVRPAKAGVAGYGLIEWLAEVAEGDFRVSVSGPFVPFP